ncbi:MAG TPA: hypothetical protein VGC18_06770 [Lacisediminihabitans sp.]|uniref:hypothetical protein n=1 Tax=Lacisediminihabitans sp. TaxID=2787631 RepID=UPI002ED8AEDA
MAERRSGDGWHEPARDIPLRWGGYRLRYVLSVALILAGALLVQATSVYTGYFLLLGLGAHIAGWLVLPSRGGRRLAAVLPSALAVSSLLIGSLACVLLVLPLVFWFYNRQRPALSYLAALLPVLSGIVLAQLFPQYGDGGIVVGVSLIVIVGAAWMGRSTAKSRQIPSQRARPLR